MINSKISFHGDSTAIIKFGDEIDEDLINTQEATFDVTYTNLEKLFWDTTKEPPRYNQQVSDDIVDEITIEDNTDDYDATRFWTIVNEWENIDGMAYIDHSQWKDTTITYEEQPIYCADISDEDAPEDCIEEIGCYWDESICEQAASNGRLQILQHAHENNCPWDEDTC